MHNKRYLSLKRFSLVLKKDLSSGIRSILITAATLAGIIFLLTVLNGIQPGGMYHPGQFTGYLFIGGFIITSLIFKEMHSKERSHEWHMLPASSLEKFGSLFLLSSIGWIIGILVIYWTASSLGEGVNRLLFHHGNHFFNPFSGHVWYMCLHYFILQSIFLLGAAYYRKAHFIKTVLFLIVFSITVAVVSLILLKLFFWNFFTWNFFSENGQWIEEWFSRGISGTGIESFFLGFAKVIKIFYFSIFAPVLWVVAYFRVAEKEVRNGV